MVLLPPARGEAAARSRGLAIAMMCGTAACYAAVDSSAKWLGLHLPVWQIIWSRYLGATLLTMLVARSWARPTLLFRSERLGLQLLRALFLLGSTAVNFIAVRYLQLADTISINFALPLAVALAAGPLLGEWVGPRRLLAILVGFGGVLVVFRPGAGSLHPAMLLCVANIFFGAGYNIMTRVVAQRDPPLTTLFFSTAGGTVLLAPFMPLSWTQPAAASQWLVLGLLGIFGALGHWLLILAHARAPASVLAPFTYTQLIWMVLSGYLLFGDVPRRSTLVGAGIVVLSGLYLLYREKVDARDGARMNSGAREMQHDVEEQHDLDQHPASGE